MEELQIDYCRFLLQKLVSNFSAVFQTVSRKRHSVDSLR